MDFLDPRKKRARHTRLMAGYVLFAIAIGLGTRLVFYGVSGLGIDTKTGNIIQNGLLFVNSQPGGADIYLNDKPHNTTTSARLVLPAGNYTLTLKKSGYRNWQRKFTLNEVSVSRYVYPFLFPVKPVAKSLKTYPAAPGVLSESPDSHWLLAQTTADDPKTVAFDQYDTSKIAQPPQILTIPASLLTNANLPGSVLAEVEWSNDNNHLLLKHDYQGGNEFIILDRQKPSESVNINKLFSLNPSQVAMRNKKFDQLYLYDQLAGSVRIGKVTDGSLANPILTHVLAFKPYGSNLISYISDTAQPAGQVQARIWDSNKSYALRSFVAGDKYLLDAAQFQGHWYYVAGSSSDQNVDLFKDPLDNLKKSPAAKAQPFLSMRENGATKVSFSANTRFVAVQAGQNFAVYDFEQSNYYHYTLTAPLAGQLVWMDGHRLIGQSAGNVFVTDYDQLNQQSLVPTVFAGGGDFNKDYTQMFTLATAVDGSSVNLQSVDMRAGADLPKQ